MSSKKTKEVNYCFECEHCLYLGEGDHLCEVNEELVTCDWESTDEFYYCEGKEFVEK